MPIVVLTECSREEATVDWGLLGAKKSQLRDTYHVQESASTEMGLRSAGIENAKYILIVADPESNASHGGGGSDRNNGSGTGGSGSSERSKSGSSWSNSSGSGGADHEDVKTLITYLAIDNCLGDMPMKDRPTIVCEAGSTMSMHVLNSRRFARITDMRIVGGAGRGRQSMGIHRKSRRRSSMASVKSFLGVGNNITETETKTLSVDVYLGSHPSGSYHRPKVPRPAGYVGSVAKSPGSRSMSTVTGTGTGTGGSGWQPHEVRPKRRKNLCSWLLTCIVGYCVNITKKICGWCCNCCAGHRHIDGENSGRNFLGIPFFSAGFAFTSRFVDTLVVQARYTPGLLEVFECLTAVRSPLIEMEEENNNIEGGKGYSNVNANTIKKDLGSIQKIEVPKEFLGESYRSFFRGMTRDYGIVPIALYRGVDVHENDNKLPYVYTCPSPDAPLMEGDSAFVLVKPKRITRSQTQTKTPSKNGDRGTNKNGNTRIRKSHRLRRGSII